MLPTTDSAGALSAHALMAVATFFLSLATVISNDKLVSALNAQKKIGRPALRF
jgi:hypothetical protein